MECKMTLDNYLGSPVTRLGYALRYAARSAAYGIPDRHITQRHLPHFGPSDHCKVGKRVQTDLL